MLSALWEMIGGGWREVRIHQGQSYQLHRSGRRRVVPVDGYRTRGMPDQGWVETGEWSDGKLADRYRDYLLGSERKPSTRSDHPRFRQPGALTRSS